MGINKPIIHGGYQNTGQTRPINAVGIHIVDNSVPTWFAPVFRGMAIVLFYDNLRFHIRMSTAVIVESTGLIRRVLEGSTGGQDTAGE